MNSELKKQILEALKDQQNIFGDFILESIEIPYTKTESIKFFKEEEVTKTEIPQTSNLFMENFQKAESLNELYDLIHTCEKCSLGKTRTNFVFGSGNPNADVMLIGEAPGEQEDKEGLPFVGRAGKLLTDILKAINFSRDEVYIANVLKCRPPNNRNPLPEEEDKCLPHLYKQIELVNPKVILCLGKVAANSLLKNKLALTQMRGEVFQINDVKTMVTYHPAALLRNPNWKRGCWEDVQKFRKLYDELK